MEVYQGFLPEILPQVSLVVPPQFSPGVTSEVLQGDSPLGVPPEFPLRLLPEVP